MEQRLVPRGHPLEDSAAFFRDRKHVPHLDRKPHQRRLYRCASLADELIQAHDLKSVSDLGCGDGGLLSIIRSPVEKWGYDVRKASVANARLGIKVIEADLLTDTFEVGDLVIITEMLEHLADPHGFLASLPRPKVILASSPGRETKDGRHDHTHVWAWDEDGYRTMFEKAGFEVIHQEMVGNFQVLVAR